MLQVKEVLEWRQGRDRADVTCKDWRSIGTCHLLVVIVVLTGEGAGIVKAAADAIAKARETCLCFNELQWCEFVQTYLAMSCGRAAARALEHVKGNDIP